MQTENGKWSRVSEFDMKTRGLKVLCGSVYTLSSLLRKTELH